MGRRARVTDTTDYYREFPEEYPGLWPQRPCNADAVDPFSEFGTETDSVDDRWLDAASGRKARPPKVHNFRHMLTAASTVIGLFMPAGVISTVIVARELTVSPMQVRHTLPPLPARMVTASVDRLIGMPGLDKLPSPPRGPTESSLVAQPAASGDPRRLPDSSAASPLPVPAALTPLPAGILHAPIATDVALGASPPPAPVPAPAPPLNSPAASSSPSRSVPSPPPGAPSDSVAIRDALDRYRVAFSKLDAGSAKSVWPAVDEKMLSRAFSQMSSQVFVFDACSVDVSGARAYAWCQGRAQYVPKVGSRTARVENRHWTFTLRRAESDWTIQSVDSR